MGNYADPNDINAGSDIPWSTGGAANINTAVNNPARKKTKPWWSPDSEQLAQRARMYGKTSPGPGGVYGSQNFDPTYMLPQGGTYNSSAAARNAGGPKAPGVLETPGALEEVWGDIKGRLSAPSRSTGWADFALPQLQGKSNLQSLYESGWDNPWYARAREKGMKDLQNRMAAAGVFGSGATGRAMYELEADLGARQANEMAGLAGAADTAQIARFGEGRATAGSTDTVNLNRDLGLANIGGNVQDAKEGRERGRFTDALQLGDRFASVFASMRDKDVAEQGRMREDIIQSIVAEGKMDYDAAAEAIDEALAGAGIFVNAAGSKKNNTGGTTTAGSGTDPSTLKPA